MSTAKPDINGTGPVVFRFRSTQPTTERIEAVVGAFLGVSDAAVRVVNTGGLDELTCAVVWRGPANVEGLKAHLRKSLPSHFVPQKFETVPSIPRNTSGKIERK